MTVIDRFIERFRSKSVLLYSAIILVSTGYVFYLIDTLPKVPPEPKPKNPKEKKESKDKKNNQKKQASA